MTHKYILAISIFYTYPVCGITKIACIGDSITFGSGVADAGDPTGTYPEILGYLLGPQYKVVNFGAPGHTALRVSDASYWNTTLFKEAQKFNPAIVIIQLGTNDSRNILKASGKPYINAVNKDLNKFMEDYSHIIETFLTKGARVFMCLPPPIYANNYGLNASIFTSYILPTLQQIAQKYSIPLINNYVLLEGQKIMYQSDLVHPNVEGLALIAHNVYATLARTLNITALTTVCSSLARNSLILPAFWWGSAQPAQQLEFLKQSCPPDLFNYTYSNGQLCSTVEKYQTSPNPSARWSAQRYYILNACSPAARQALVNAQK